VQRGSYIAATDHRQGRPYDGIATSRLFDGSRFSIALLGNSVIVVVLIVIGSLVLSGQLPPRGW